MQWMLYSTNLSTGVKQRLALRFTLTPAYSRSVLLPLCWVYSFDSPRPKIFLNQYTDFSEHARILGSAFAALSLLPILAAVAMHYLEEVS